MGNHELLNTILQLAVILLSTKFLGLISRRLGLPEVVGNIIAGLILGTAIWNSLGLIAPDGWIFPIRESSELQIFAKIGVLLILFKAGLETDLKAMRQLGVTSLLIALGGVLVPLGFGFGLGALLLPTYTWHTWIFIGTIMTATSVGITIETLKALGKLNTKVGAIITSAAIIDDVIGMIVLTIVISLANISGEQNAVLSVINPSNLPVITILWMFVFFAVAIGAGLIIIKLFNRINKKKANVHRVPIYSLAICFIYAFVAENVFGVADITGAYFAGAILSVCHNTAHYADKKLEVGSYTIFSPMFFAYIGIQLSFSSFSNLSIVIVAVVFVILAISGKILGCGGIAMLTGFDKKDSMRIGVGMIARGEVALAVTTTGIAGGLIGNEYIAMTVLLVLVSSILAPILLKVLYKNEPELTDVTYSEGSYE